MPIDSSFFLVDHVKLWSAMKLLMKRVHKWSKSSGGWGNTTMILSPAQRVPGIFVEINFI